MQFMDAVKIAFKKYADFRGVATRAEYWWFFLFVFLVSMIGGAFDMAIRQAETGPVQSLLSVALFLPQITIMVRRFRDAGVSPFWLLTWIIPIGLLVAVIIVNISNFMYLVENAGSLAAQLNALSGDEAASLAFLDQYPNLVTMVMSFLAVVAVFLIVAIFQFVVTLIPSKKPKQPVVATLDY